MAKDYSKYWNEFCKKDKEYIPRIEELSKLDVGLEGIKVITEGLNKVLEDRDNIQEEFVDKILYELPPEKVVWYLERATKLNDFLRQNINRTFDIQCPKITPIWAMAIRKLYRDRTKMKESSDG